MNTKRNMRLKWSFKAIGLFQWMSDVRYFDCSKSDTSSNLKQLTY